MRLLKRTLVSTGVAVCFFALSMFAQSPAASPGQSDREMRDGQYLRAEAELLRALKSNPQNGSLWFSLGVTRVHLKKIDLAIEAFEKALPIYSEKAPVYFDLGLLYMEKNDLPKAEDAYARGLALDPSNVPANQNDALLLMHRGAFHDALVPLQLLKEANPSDVSARATLIEAFLKAGLKEQAKTEIDELLSSHIVTLPQGLALAKLLAAHRETDLAQHIFGFLRSTWPASAEAHGELGLILEEKEQFNDAAVELGRSLQLDPGSLKYSLSYGEALISSQQYSVALEFLQGALKKFADQPNFRYQLALTDICLQRFSEAADVLESLTQARPDSSKVQFLLGGAYELQGELQKAEGHYRSAIRLGPRESKYYRVLGSMLQKQGPEHLDESIQLLRKGLTLDPTDSEIKIVLARCLEKQGELDDAAALLEQAVVSEPASRRAHSALAELYRRQEKMALAEREQLIAASLEDQKITKEWTIWGAQSAGDP